MFRAHIGSCLSTVLWLVCIVLSPNTAAGAGLNVPGPEHTTDREGPPGSNIIATRAAGDIRIDGTVDPLEWVGAPVISDFTARNPIEGAAPSQLTEVCVLYTSSHLYIAFSCYDNEPEGIVYRVATRDSWLLQSDKVQVDIDPYHDHRHAFHFVVGVANNQVDADGIDINWDGVWESATRITDEGWFAEIAIPFSILRFEPKELHTFGINFSRNIQRTKEDLLWRSWRRDDTWRVDRYGQLENLQGLGGARRLELMPYAKVSGQQFYRSDSGNIGYDSDRTADTGLDLKYAVTSNMALDVALNPDFGQIAPDQEQINVTRYERYYQELRPFFQEGQSVFRTPMQIFYSRRIGKQIYGGPEVNLLAGTKLIGRTGAYQIGLINAVTERKEYTTAFGTEAVVPMANYAVVRIKRDILSRSSIGILAANKDSRSDTLAQGGRPYQRVVGFDVSLNFQDNRYITGQVAHSINPGEGGDDWVGHLKAGLRSDLWEYSAEINYLGPRFDVREVGYITQVDRRNIKWNLGWKPRPERNGIRRIELTSSGHASRNFTGDYTYGQYGVEFALQTMKYTNLNVKASVNDSRWRDVYAPVPILTDVLARLYRSRNYSLSFNTDSSLDYSFNASLSFGNHLDYEDYYWGRDRTIRAGFSFRPSSRFSGSLSFTHIREYFRDNTLDEAKNLLVTRASYYFTSNLAIKLYNQTRLYTDTGEGNRDEAANTLNLVLSYFLNAKSVLYVVYNEIRADDILNWQYYERYGRLPVSDRALLLKITYWFNL